MELIEKLESKVRVAINKIVQLEEQVKVLEERNRVLEEENQDRDQKVEKLLLELDNLPLSQTEERAQSIVQLEDTEELSKF